MKNLNLTFYAFAGISSMPVTLLAGQFQPEKKSIDKQHPNIVLIVADDLGYGDLSCYGADAIQTPGMDRIANEGIRFTQGFCTAATSTPSRYSVMTGRYPWTNPDAKILPGNAKLIIDTEAITLPKVMKQAGYITGSVGKWHIGLGDGNVDWNKRVYPGASEIGYDYSFIQAATNDRVPCVFLENNKVIGLEAEDPLYVDYRKNFPGEPTGKDNPELLYNQKPSFGHDQSIVNGISRIGYMKGGGKALWKDENIADSIVTHAIDFIKENKEKPFFMYFATNDVHVPRFPHDRFRGKNPMGVRGDAIEQFDWSVGQLMKTLDEMGLTENTLIILSSDNGPVVDDGYADRAVELLGDHKPAGPLRGNKYSAFEGGTRIPAIVHWPKEIKQAAVSDALVSQIDWFASLASLTNSRLPEGSAPDSYDYLDTWIGKSKEDRPWVIEQALNKALSVRTKDWKYIEPSVGSAIMEYEKIETGYSPEPQLYDMTKVYEEGNKALQHPEIVFQLQGILKGVRDHTIKAK